MVKEIAAEVAEVARARGVGIDLDAVRASIDFACREHRDHQASMLQDLLAGRRTEVDALNGAVVEAAVRSGVDAPLNRLLATLLRLAEPSALAQTR